MVNKQYVTIIDDDESVRLAIGSLVRSLGLTAHLFASAEAFLHDDAHVRSDCIVTDVQMPGMSGIELQELLRRQQRNVPIIFMTAFPEASLRKRAHQGGATCFLTKPFDGAAIIRCIELALSTDHTIF